ncbi:hypothetical protein D3C81_1343400 [compost metagenome]
MFGSQFFYSHFSSITQQCVVFISKFSTFTLRQRVNTCTEHITESIREVIERNIGNVKMELGCPEMWMVLAKSTMVCFLLCLFHQGRQFSSVQHALLTFLIEASLKKEPGMNIHKEGNGALNFIRQQSNLFFIIWSILNQRVRHDHLCKSRSCFRYIHCIILIKCRQFIHQILMICMT